MRTANTKIYSNIGSKLFALSEVFAPFAYIRNVKTKGGMDIICEIIATDTSEWENNRSLFYVNLNFKIILIEGNPNGFPFLESIINSQSALG